MEFDKEDQQEPIMSEVEPNIKESVNWIYLLIIACPTLLFSIIMAIISSVTSMKFLEDNWQIWTFIFSIPFLGLIGGVFLKQNELQKSYGYANLFLMGYMALIVSVVAGILEIMKGSSPIQILITFSGGFLYGGIFGLILCGLLVLTTLCSYWILILIKRKKEA